MRVVCWNAIHPLVYALSRAGLWDAGQAAEMATPDGYAALQAIRVAAEHLDARAQPAFGRVVVLGAAPGHMQFEG